MCDVTALISSNEGWGLSLTEAMMCGKMIIANVTGGMQDQLRFEDETGKWIDFDEKFPSNHFGKYRKHGEWSEAVFPSNMSIVGSIPTPYIFDDRVDFRQVAEAIKKIYDLPYETIELKLPEYIYNYYCYTVDKRVLDAKFPGIDSATILKEYGSLITDKNGDELLVLTLDDFIYCMNVIKTEKKINENSKIAIAGYHYFIDYNYVLNLIPKPKISFLIEYGFIDNYEKQIMAQHNLEYIIETHHEIVLDINDKSLIKLALSKIEMLNRRMTLSFVNDSK
jgi:hypothetical protein